MASFPSFASCLAVTENKEMTGHFDNNNTLCFTAYLESQRYVELNVKGYKTYG
nr:hypothetical protein [Proteus terrae subsp. cibarius]